MSLLVVLRHPVTVGAHPVLTAVRAEGAWEKLTEVKTLRHVPIGAVTFPAGLIRLVLPWVEDADTLSELVEELKDAGLQVRIDATLEEES